MKRMREKDGFSRGFTLVEVIVVCVILALLAAVSIPSLIGYIDKKKADECRVNRKSLMLMYSAEKVKNPSASMNDILNGAEGKKVRCPSGGSYSASGDVLRCSIPGHGEELLTADNIPADQVPDRGDPPAVVTPVPTTELPPTGTPEATDTPTSTPVPTDTEKPKPSVTPDPEEEEDIREELEDMAGDWEDYVEWVVEYKKNHPWGWVPGVVERGAIFKEKTGNHKKYGIYVGYDPMDMNDVKNENTPMESRKDMLIIDLSVIFLEKDFEAMRESFRKGDLYYDGEEYYVYAGSDAGENDPASRPPSYQWVKIFEFDDDILDEYK